MSSLVGEKDAYCSDIQRVLYFLARDETEPPEPVQRGFETMVRAIEAAVAAMRPGMLGKEAATEQPDPQFPPRMTRTAKS
jgi:Xaa-Pro aminopeptidase